MAEYTLKRISPSGVPAALQKAERYRFLNDSSDAESICRDILETDPDNQQALVMLLLAITDQFGEDEPGRVDRRAREVLPRLRDDYKRAYYAGILCERRAKAQRRRPTPGSDARAYDSFREAMDWYEKAEALRPAGNDESLLRWNTCARILMSDDHLRPQPAEEYEPALEE